MEVFPFSTYLLRELFLMLKVLIVAQFLYVDGSGGKKLEHSVELLVLKKACLFPYNWFLAKRCNNK